MGFGKKKDPFNRRTYEKSIDDIEMPPHYFGFTNRILSQTQGSIINLFVPVYVILRIKSLQGIDVQNLTGDISAVLLVNVLIENLSQPLIYLLSNQIELQINRSEPLFLRDDRENCITLSRSKKMLRFTIRKNFTASINQETFWSPFSILRLIISITFNNIRKRNGVDIQTTYLKHQDSKNKNIEIGKDLAEAFGMVAPTDKKGSHNKDIDFNQFRYYTISFNCMRNGLRIPISYSLGCVYSLYDLAQNMLEVYHTHLNSYSEVTQKYKQHVSRKQQSWWSKLFSRKEQQDDYVWQPEQEGKQITKKRCKQDLVRLNRQVYKLLEERRIKRQLKKENNCKPSYCQYTHFIIPLYKYPGNSLLTIFIPIALLSLLSLAIFFQDNNLSDRIGLIATMVLGYIQLIPSIKNELPPSSKITAIQMAIYLSSLCCLFSLIESFMIDHTNYVFVWSKNKLFIFCLVAHSCIFLFVTGLYVVHKLIWQPFYNKENQPRKSDPEQDPEEWINMFCDQQFYMANEAIYKHNINPKNQQKKNMISKYNFHLEGEHKYSKAKTTQFNKESIGDLKLTTLFASSEVRNKVTKKEGLDQSVTFGGNKPQKKDSRVEVSIPEKQEEKEPLIAQAQPYPKKQESEQQQQQLEYMKRLKLLDRISDQNKHISWNKWDKTYKITQQPSPTKQKNQ